jgi:predicted dehydrogenase
MKAGGMMTDTLRRVLERVEHLAPEEQEVVAEQMEALLDELEQERGWKERLHDPKALPALEALIERAIAADDAGRSVDLEQIL